MSSIMTSIRQVDGGSVIKSGDTSSVFKFEILDDDFVKKDLTGTGKLVIFNSKNVILYQDVEVENGSFSFKFGKVVAPGYYKLEIKLDGYVFPTGDFDIRVRPSFYPANSVPKPIFWAKVSQRIWTRLKKSLRRLLLLTGTQAELS